MWFSGSVEARGNGNCLPPLTGALSPLHAQEKKPHTCCMCYSDSKEHLPVFLPLCTLAFSRDTCFSLGIDEDSLPLGSAPSLAPSYE